MVNGFGGEVPRERECRCATYSERLGAALERPATRPLSAGRSAAGSSPELASAVADLVAAVDRRTASPRHPASVATLYIEMFECLLKLHCNSISM